MVNSASPLPRGSFVQYPQGVMSNDEGYWANDSEWAWNPGMRPIVDPVTNTINYGDSNKVTDPELNVALFNYENVLGKTVIERAIALNTQGRGAEDTFAAPIQVGQVIPIQQFSAALQGPPTSALVPAPANTAFNGQPVQYNPQAIGGLFAPPVDGLFRTANGGVIPTQEYLNNVNTIGYPNALSVAGRPFALPVRQAGSAQFAQAMAPSPPQAPQQAMPPTGLEQMMSDIAAPAASSPASASAQGLSPVLAQAEQNMQASDTDFYAYLGGVNNKIAGLQSAPSPAAKGDDMAAAASSSDGFDGWMNTQNDKMANLDSLVTGLINSTPKKGAAGSSSSGTAFDSAIGGLSGRVNSLGQGANQSANQSAAAYGQQNAALRAQLEQQLEKNMQALQNGNTPNIEKQRLINENNGLLQQLQGLQISDGAVARSTGGANLTLPNNFKLNPKSPTLSQVANLLNSGRAETRGTGLCVTATLENLEKATGKLGHIFTSADPNNPRGALVQVAQAGYKSIPIGQAKEVNSPYGKTTVYAMSAAEYKQAFAQGLIPVGAVGFANTKELKDGLFNTAQLAGGASSSSGRDMFLVKKDGSAFNYQDNAGLSYGANTDQVVVMVPPDAVA